ncbi:MAG: efflux RND transporter periplasmic adaptor subunit, partial [Betaproteobacteria bacterium]|nr:efflux RND transporter periplasmic adaptor subunit [Betaproteobacteria bacterium]
MLDPLPETGNPRGLKQAGIATAVIAALIVAGGLFSRASDSARAAHWSQAQSMPTVHLVMPTTAGQSQILTLPGTLEAWNTAHIFARVPGYIHAWYRDIGASVGNGTPLG